MANLMTMDNENYVGNRRDGAVNWILARKFQIIIGLLCLVFVAILSANSYYQAKISEKIENMETKLEQIDDLKSELKNVEKDLKIQFETIVEKNEEKFDAKYKNLKSETEKNFGKLESKVKKHAFHSRAAAARSCQELFDHGFREDGYYNVDPDGRYTGQKSFEVYCKNLAHGWDVSTIVPINSEESLNISTSSTSDFKFKMNYKANTQQLKELVKNSGYCYQEIKIECHAIPLHYQGSSHGYWLDINGVERSFFDGSDQKSQRCDCGKNGACQDNPKYLCNCDLRSKHSTSDNGVISAYWLLPIQEFQYKFLGHSLDTFDPTNGSATVTIGDLVCEGNF